MTWCPLSVLLAAAEEYHHYRASLALRALIC